MGNSKLGQEKEQDEPRTFCGIKNIRKCSKNNGYKKASLRGSSDQHRGQLKKENRITL